MVQQEAHCITFVFVSSDESLDLLVGYEFLPHRAVVEHDVVSVPVKQAHCQRSTHGDAGRVCALDLVHKHSSMGYEVFHDNCVGAVLADDSAENFGQEHEPAYAVVPAYM